MLLSTKADLTNIQNKVNKQDIVAVCAQERQNTKWQFKLVTNESIFATLLKNVPMGCPDSVIPEPFLRNSMLIVWFRIKTQNNHTLIICVCFELLHFICMEQLVLKHPHPRFFDAYLEKSGWFESISWSFDEWSTKSWRCSREKHLYLRYRNWRCRFCGWISSEKNW